MSEFTHAPDPRRGNPRTKAKCTPHSRRLLPLASTAMALSLVGCGAKAAKEPVANAQSQAALEQVESFTSNIDNVDPARLKAAMDGQPLPPRPVPAKRSAPASTQPAELQKIAAAAATQPAVEAPLEAVVPAMLAAVKSYAYEPLTSISPPVAKAAAPVAVTAPAVVRAAEPTYEDALNIIRKRALARPTLNSALAVALLENAEGKASGSGIVAGLSSADQKLFADLVDALQGMTVPVSAGASLNDRAAPLVDAARKWQTDSDLSLPKVALASRVDSFGVYTALVPKFPQGERRTVIIYCEVANFSSKRAADNWFETRLSQQESLITDDGLLVWRPNAEEVEDRSLNQRHDFYLVKKMTIPENLAVGKYTLRMNVTDRTSNKIAMVSMPIEIIENR